MPPRFILISAACLLHRFLLPPLVAEVVELSPFEVVSSRIPGEATGQVSLNPDTFQSGLYGNTWEALGSISGLHIEQAAGMGGNASLYLRGGEPNSTKVLIDGVDVGNIMDIRGGSYNFNGIGLIAADQINILAGSRSAIHGSDALSGIISISTLPSDWEQRATEGQLMFQLGNGGLIDSAVSQSVRLGKALVDTGASYTREDSWQEGSEFDARRFHLGAATIAGDGTVIRFSSFGSRITRSHFPDDSGGPIYAVWRDTDNHEAEQLGSSIQTATGIQEDLVLKTLAYYYRFDETVVSPGVAPGERDPFGVPPNTVINHLNRYQVSGYLLHDLVESLSLVYGVSYLQDDGDSSSTVLYPFATIDGEYTQSVKTLSAFAEAGWQLAEGVRMNAAVRHDDVEDLDAVWTGRLEGILSFPASNSELSVSWGTGFKKPTFFALGNPVVGNPDLLPEESDLYELAYGISFHDNKIRLNSSVFRQEYENLIDFSETPPPRMINLNQVVSKGMTIQVEMKPAGNAVYSIDVTYIELDVVDSSELLRNRPKWKAGVSARHPLGTAVEMHVRGQYIGNRLDSSIPTGTRTLEGYFTLDSGLIWKVNPKLRASIFIDNLLDEKYEELIGFVSPGIRLRGQLQFSW